MSTFAGRDMCKTLLVIFKVGPAIFWMGQVSKSDAVHGLARTPNAGMCILLQSQCRPKMPRQLQANSQRVTMQPRLRYHNQSLRYFEERTAISAGGGTLDI